MTTIPAAGPDHVSPGDHVASKQVTMSGFLSPLQLEFIDGKTWKVVAPVRYHLGGPEGEEYVEVPVNFVTDFASIPRGLWNLFPPAWYGKAAVVHDFLYQISVIHTTAPAPGLRIARICDRKEADGIFRDALLVLGKPRWLANGFYLALRAFGWIAWNKARAIEAGRRA